MLPWLALPAAVIGFALGGLSALLTERLEPTDDPEIKPIRGKSLLVRDPLVQGALAILCAAGAFATEGDVLRTAELGLLTVPLVQVAVTDLRTRYVYTVIAGIGLLLGIAFGWQVHNVQWIWSVVGAVGGLLAFAALYGIGRL